MPNVHSPRNEIPHIPSHIAPYCAPPIQVHVPYGEFFKSLPVWAVTVAHFSFNWGYYTLLAWLPSYFEMALGLEVRTPMAKTKYPLEPSWGIIEPWVSP